MKTNKITVQMADWKEGHFSPTPRLPLVRNILPTLVQMFCPHCESILYSRKSRWCGACGRVLPAKLLFSDAESATVQNLIENEKRRHRQWMQKADSHGSWTFVE